jgi:hypothetical protein
VPTWSGIRKQKLAAEKAQCHRRGTVKAAEKAFVKNENDLKSRIPLLQQTKKKKTQEKIRLPKQSNQNSLIPSESRNNETKGLLKKNRIPRMKSKFIQLNQNSIQKFSNTVQHSKKNQKKFSTTV